MNKFSIAYDSFVSSQSSYASVTSRFSPALTSIESSFSQSSQYLSQFYASLDSISDGISFKSDISELSLMLNSTLSNVQSSFASTKQVSVLVLCVCVSDNGNTSSGKFSG